MSEGAPAVLEVQGLSKHFRLGGGALFSRRRQGAFVAVDDVSFTVARGETLGVVGESGSGKSTVARMLLRLIEPTAGSIRLNGNELTGLPADRLRRQRRGIQMVFQDPFASLNPRLSIGYHLAEPMIVHEAAGRADVPSRVEALLERVGLSARHARSHPHALSGGQRQRVAIARALAVEPDILVADEAVSSLDVSVQAQILNLLRDIRRDTRLSMVFISHDLGVVRHVADRVAVMYRGRIVEIGPIDDVFDTPRHPYTRALLDAIPVPAVGARAARPPQAPAGAMSAGSEAGCQYVPRCPLAEPGCSHAVPALDPAGDMRLSACFRPYSVPAAERRVRAGDDAAALRLRRLQERFLAGPALGSAQ